MKVADIMTQPVLTVTPDTTIAETARLLLQHRISGLPVVDKAGAVVGIVTEADLLRRAETGTERHHLRWLEFLISPGRLAHEYAGAHARKVSEIMTEEIVSVASDDPLEKVVNLMERRHIKRLPVIDAGELVGIVSRANLVRALVHNLTRAVKGVGDDAALREQILGEIAKQPWGPKDSVDVKVSDGVVDLFGTITDDRERTALMVLAENIAGVKAVRDHLVWVEPMSGMVVEAEAAGPPSGTL